MVTSVEALRGSGTLSGWISFGEETTLTNVMDLRLVIVECSYSPARNASMGLTRAAFLAGRRFARTPTARRITATPP